MQLQEIVSSFNTTALEFVSQLKKICPHSLIANNVDALESIMNNKASERKVLDQYALHVLKYKGQIDSYDEDFFMNNDFTAEASNALGELDKKPNVGSITTLICELKDMWKTVESDNKRKVFDYLRVLSYYAQEYVLLITN